METEADIPIVNVSVKNTNWTIKRAIFEVTLPVLAALVMSLPLFFAVVAPGQQSQQTHQNQTPNVPQIPVNRDLIVPVKTIDSRDFIVTVKGRQIDNYEENQWCEYAWSGRIYEMVAKSGTIFINGKYHLDDFVSTQEGGIESAITQDLVGKILESKNCRFDILSITLQEQQR
jgi:hypothetical protein